jgi:hypothetical protein
MVEIVAMARTMRTTRTLRTKEDKGDKDKGDKDKGGLPNVLQPAVSRLIFRLDPTCKANVEFK